MITETDGGACYWPAHFLSERVEERSRQTTSRHCVFLLFRALEQKLQSGNGEVVCSQLLNKTVVKSLDFLCHKCCDFAHAILEVRCKPLPCNSSDNEKKDMIAWWYWLFKIAAIIPNHPQFDQSKCNSDFRTWKYRGSPSIRMVVSLSRV